MSEASVTVIVVEDSKRAGYDSPMVSHKPFFAFVAANPQMRAQGETEEKAVEGLRKLIRSHCFGRVVKVFDLRLDELLVEEVMHA